MKEGCGICSLGTLSKTEAQTILRSTPWTSRCGLDATRRRAQGGGTITTPAATPPDSPSWPDGPTSQVAQLGFERDSWVAPVDARRVKPVEDTDDVATEQVRALVERLPQPNPV